MARKTIASLEETIAKRDQQLKDMQTALNEKQQHIEELKKMNAGLRAAVDEARKDLIKANKRMARARAVAAQMQGFIRAHHTEKVPTGNMEGFYDAAGNYINRPIMMDVYPFMEHDMSGEDEITEDNPNGVQGETWGVSRRYMK